MTRLIDADALKEYIDCGHLRNPCEVCFSELDVVNLIDAQPTIDAEPHWIPVSERLPEDDRSKVVTLANGNAEVGYYSNGDWWCVGDKVTLENQTVIAWMPLPKPYEVDDDR